MCVLLVSSRGRESGERERAFVMRWVLCAHESGGVNELYGRIGIYIYGEKRYLIVWAVTR